MNWREHLSIALALAGAGLLVSPGPADLRWMIGGYALLLVGAISLPQK